jgi:Mor family transcriptional regulator
MSSLKYVNADDLLPEKLLKEIQHYVQGETIYIPKPRNAYKKWGSQSGSRAFIDKRNAGIKQAFKNGKTIDQLGLEYHLSCETIKKIVYRK